ncbi:ABC transporter ATP-binding protein [Candidatus Dojkabacteria bacterium]|nr:ABC transporter ATP-binding protein [Candidatus Dojkabacteria bacterium]
MKYDIKVNNLRKEFQIYRKEAGLKGTIKGLFKREYSTVRAVNNVSFTIERGEFVGFIGPNGAGKTTTLKCLSGLLYPTSGNVSVLGYEPWERRREFLKRISLVMGQKNQLWWDLPAMDSFLMNKDIYEIDEDTFYKKVDDLIDLLGVGDVVNIPIRKLSLGQRMKCELLSSLLHSPQILFLDEPTIGLDVVMQKKLRTFFKDFNRRFETTVMLTSHYMDDVKELCKRVIIIDDGVIMYDGSISNLIRSHAKFKTISFVANKKIDRADLDGLGEVVKLDDLSGVLKVERDNVPIVSSKLLKSFNIEDLNIDEMGLDDVIREIFSKG